MMRNAHPIARWLLILLLVALGVGYLVLQLGYNNEALANKITERFNRDRRGQLEIESVHWGPKALWAFAMGNTARVTVLNLRLRDSRGQVVLAVPRAEVEVRPRDLLGQGRIAIHLLKIRRGWMAWDRYRRPDGPSPSGDPNEIGLLGAMEPRPVTKAAPPPRRRPPPPAPARPSPDRYLWIQELDLSGITVRGSDRNTEVLLRQVSLRGNLAAITLAGGTNRLELDLQASAPHGFLRVGHREVPLSDVSLGGRSGTGHGKDELELTAGTRSGGAHVDVEGRLRGLPSKSQPALRLAVRAQRFGPVLRELGVEPLLEDGSRLQLLVEGRLGSPTMEAHVSGLGWGAERGAPRLVGATLTYRRGLVRIETARARAWGGTFHTVGWLATGPWDWGLDAQLLSLNAPWLLRRHMPEVDLDISGLMHGVGTLRGARRSMAFMTLAITRRTDASPLPRMVKIVGALTGSRARIRLHRIAAWSELGALQAEGSVTLPQRQVDLDLQVHTWRLREHLRPIGHRLLIDGVDLRGRLQGPALAPAFEGKLALHDFRTDLVRVSSLQSPLSLRGGRLWADELHSPRYGRYLQASVRLTLFEGSLRHLRRPSLDFSWGIGRRR